MKLHLFFSKKFGLKLFSLLLAILVWFFIRGEVVKTNIGETAYKDLTVDIRLMGEPLFLGKNLGTVELDEHQLDLRVKGPEREIERISRLDIYAYVDISGLRPGKSYDLTVKYILPPNVEVIGSQNWVRVVIKDKI